MLSRSKKIFSLTTRISNSYQPSLIVFSGLRSYSSRSPPFCGVCSRTPTQSKTHTAYITLHHIRTPKNTSTTYNTYRIPRLLPPSPSFFHPSLSSIFHLSSPSLGYYSLIRSPLDLSGFLFQPNERATFDEGCCSFPFSLCPPELPTAPLYSHTRTHVVPVAPQHHGGSPAASRGPRVKR